MRRWRKACPTSNFSRNEAGHACTSWCITVVHLHGLLHSAGPSWCCTKDTAALSVGSGSMWLPGKADPKLTCVQIGFWDAPPCKNISARAGVHPACLVLPPQLEKGQPPGQVGGCCGPPAEVLQCLLFRPSWLLYMSWSLRPQAGCVGA